MEFNLNYVIRGDDPSHIVTVKISCANAVDRPRHAIKIKKGCMFCDADIPLEQGHCHVASAIAWKTDNTLDAIEDFSCKWKLNTETKYRFLFPAGVIRTQ